MTEKKNFKRRVRERMSKTGESYTTARTQVETKRDRNDAAKARLRGSGAELMADAKLKEATGRTWEQWIALLDRAGGRKMKHGEIAKLLQTKHEVPGWWSQTITVGYERATGKRVKHQQADGFSISVTKTVNVGVEEAFEAIVKKPQRKRWLREDDLLKVRTSRERAPMSGEHGPGRGARFDYDGGTSRVVVDVASKGPAKSVVAVAHEKLPDADDAEIFKSMWRKRLSELKAMLEER